MQNSPQAWCVLRFGVFEADLRTGELRKKGLKVKLPPQAFQVLAKLLENPGEVVTRDELRKRIWPEDTFVDFDHSLGTAINRIREVLGDSAENPRFVETLPRSGYRFMAPVSLAGSNLGGLFQRPLETSPVRIQSIAVLPFENLSQDPEQEYFSDGLTEVLITNLAKIGALRVISRTSVMRYKVTKKILPEIARELNVDAIVEGSVQRSEERVRITANLVHGSTDRHLWAESYERDLRDALALQSEVAQAIVQEIHLKLTSKEEAHLAMARPVYTEAYELYLRGRYYWNKRTEEGLRKGIEYFQQAIEKDPTYALAYCGLADSNIASSAYGLRPAREGYPKARAAAKKALELDQSLAEAHTALACVAGVFDWNFTLAEKEFRRAISLDPNYATAHQWYAGVVLAAMGRHSESIAEIKRALELDPLSPPISAHFGQILFLADRNAQAIEQLKRTVEIENNFPQAHVYLGRSYVRAGMYAEAIQEFQTAARICRDQPFYLAWLGYGYAAVGKRDEARKILGELKELPKHKNTPPYEMVFIWTTLGQKDEAFACLRKAYDDRGGWFYLLNVEPELKLLRCDPRFADLVRRMGLPP